MPLPIGRLSLVRHEKNLKESSEERDQMKVGVDGSKIPAASEGPLAALDQANQLGLDGVFFRTVLDLSPTLDVGFLTEVRAHADELGLYLEMGLGKVNPYTTAEAPEIRRLGGGDYRLGLEKMIRAC